MNHLKFDPFLSNTNLFKLHTLTVSTVKTLTGTEISAERSEAEFRWLLEKKESESGRGSFQMLGKSLQSVELRPTFSFSRGNSIKSSMWSKKLPQSISSTTFDPIYTFLIFFFSTLKNYYLQKLTQNH